MSHGGSGAGIAWRGPTRCGSTAISRALAAPAGFGGARALATALYVGDDAEDLLPLARTLAEAAEGRGGVSLVNGLLVARLLGARPELVRRDLMRYIAGCGRRPAVSRRPAARLAQLGGAS